jgi:hypothetical protein
MTAAAQAAGAGSRGQAGRGDGLTRGERGFGAGVGGGIRGGEHLVGPAQAGWHSGRSGPGLHPGAVGRAC